MSYDKKSKTKGSGTSNGVKDPWCNPLQLPNGSQISGAAAREFRIKEAEVYQALLMRP